MRAAEPDRTVTAVKLGLLLLHDIGLDRDPQVIGLPGQVGGGMIVLSPRIEGGLPQVAPQHGDHAQLMGHLEGLGCFLQLAHPLVGTEVHGRANRNRAQLPRLLNAREHDLVVAVGVGQQLVVVQLDEEGDAVGVAARHGTQHTERGGDGVAPAFHGQFADVAGVEIDGIRRKRSPRRVLDPLVDGEDGDIAGSGEPPVAQNLLHAAQHLGTPVRARDHAVDEVGAGKVELVAGEAHGAIGQEVLGFGAEEVVDSGGCGHGVVLVRVEG